LTKDLDHSKIELDCKNGEDLFYYHSLIKLKFKKIRNDGEVYFKNESNSTFTSLLKKIAKVETIQEV
jgi:hypothetical protein